MSAKGQRSKDVTDLLLVIWILHAVSTLALVLRCLTDIKVYKRISWACIWLGLAYVFETLTGTYLTLCLQLGVLSPSNLSLDELARVIKYQTWANIFSTVAPWLGRISFAVWILRMTSRTWMRITLWACILSTSSTNISFIVYFAVHCRPRSKGVVGQFQAGTCWASDPTIAMTYAEGAANTAVDLVLSILPAVLVARLEMPVRLKISCIAILFVSSVAAASSLIRTIEFPKLLRAGVNNVNVLNTEAAKLCLLWMILETHTVIIVTSIPAIRPLFLKINRSPRYGDRRASVLTPLVTPPDCLTSWTGFVGCPLYDGRVDSQMGTTITIEAGVKDGAGPFAWNWFKKRRGSAKSEVGVVQLKSVSVTDRSTEDSS